MLSLSPILIIAGFALITAPTIFAIVNLVKTRKHQKHALLFYEDIDGTATEQSLKDFSAKIPITALIAFLLLSFASISTLAVLQTVSDHAFVDDNKLLSKWLITGMHLALLIQAAGIAFQKNPVQRFQSAVYLTACTLLVSAPVGHVLSQWNHHNEKALLLADIASLAAALLAVISIPRRPAVYLDDKPVDGERNVSILNRLSYTWLYGVIHLVRKRKSINLDDLPIPGYQSRSSYLLKTHPTLKPGQSLLSLMFRSHGTSFALQWLITFVDAVLVQGPQVLLYALLRALERRHAGESPNERMTLWVVLLGVVLVVGQFFLAGMWYVSYAYLHVPIRVHISALVFTKALRRKDVKGVADTSGELDSEENDNKTQQGTINLIGVDAFRLSWFATTNNWFFGALCKVLVSFAFLAYLVGWQALLGGLAVQVAAFPLNAYFSKKYTDAENRVMKARDQKLAVLTEILKGIRHVKFSAFEEKVQSQISAVRDTELREQWSTFLCDIGLAFCWLVGPVLLSAVSLGVYAIVHGELTPSVAFTTMGVLGAIQITLAAIPQLFTEALDAWISLKRVQNYLQAPEKENNTTPGDSVELKEADIAWPADEEDAEREFILRQANVSFPNDKLSIISGPTGSGKSLLLASILGEVDLLSGSINVPRVLESSTSEESVILTDANWIEQGSIAFVSQQPWIENATFRDNIIFGLPYDHRRYEAIVYACALSEDRKILSDGDETEIGANGINLSGGQKWRITLARALYSRASILILDDIFSAVDSHVGRHIFDNALCGDLGKGRTKILATHHVSLVAPAASYVVHLDNGQVKHADTVEELRKTGAMQAILLEEDQEHQNPTEEVEENVSTAVTDGGHGSTNPFHAETPTQGVVAMAGNPDAPIHPSDLKEPESVPNGFAENGKTPVAPKKFVEEETKEVGRVATAVYMRYWKANGIFWFWIAYVMVLIGNEIITLGRSWWVKIWTHSYDTSSSQVVHPSYHSVYQMAYTGRWTPKPQAMDSQMQYYLGIYFAFAFALCLIGVLRHVCMFVGSIRASRILFENLTYSVLRAPLRWLDTMPLGRVLNRFTADFNVIDSELAWTTSSVFEQTLMIIGIVGAGIVVSPWVLVFSLVLLAISWSYALLYLDGTREMKRLESIAKSPIFDTLGAALSGIGTIRAFKKTESYTKDMFAKIDVYGASTFCIYGMNRWLSIRLGIIGAFFAVLVAGVVSSIEGFDPSLAGFALSFALQYTDTVFWLLRQFGMVEMAMNAVERVLEYTDIPTESQGGNSAPAVWPSKGRLEIENLVVGYADDLPAVLRGISFDVEPNQRCAVIGRTGAGKSSLALALFRFLAAREGRILIDGIDIASLKLKDLRSRLAIIPQDPVLFSGTIRSNLDPFGEHTDDALRESLERVHLIPSRSSGSNTPIPALPDASKSTNVNPFASLSTTIAESGSNLSQGQRQLLCLARAILTRPKILILDEATSAVDKATDTLIQRSIREQFSDSTLLVIAHRLSTIADFDKICVLGEGKVVEFDTPKTLLRKEGGKGAFAQMVGESGEKDVIRDMILGKGAKS